MFVNVDFSVSIVICKSVYIVFKSVHSRLRTERFRHTLLTYKSVWLVGHVQINYIIVVITHTANEALELLQKRL